MIYEMEKNMQNYSVPDITKLQYFQIVYDKNIEEMASDRVTA